MKIFYSDRYCAETGTHVVDGERPRLVADEMRRTGINFELVEPKLARVENLLSNLPEEFLVDLLRAHDTKYIAAVIKGEPTELSKSQGFNWEDEESRIKLVESILLRNAGLLEASETALNDGISGSLGGGFHHAHMGRGYNYCTFNGLAIATKKVQHKGLSERVLIVDCDVHYGDGTADIFVGDDSVFTLSIAGVVFAPGLVPNDGETNKLVRLKTGSCKQEYLDVIGKNVPEAIEKIRPGLIIYNAGADPYKGDGMSPLNMDVQDLLDRDRMIFGIARKYGIPISYCLAGSYAKQKEKSVEIFVNTFRAAKEAFEE